MKPAACCGDALERQGFELRKLAQSKTQSTFLMRLAVVRNEELISKRLNRCHARAMLT